MKKYILGIIILMAGLIQQRFSLTKNLVLPGDMADREVIVDLVDELPLSEVLKIEAKIGHPLIAASENSYDPHRLLLVQLGHSDKTEVSRVVHLLENDVRVEAVGPNYSMSLLPLEEEIPLGAVSSSKSEGPNDPLFKYQWHMQMIHAPEAWTVRQGEGVTVAVIDTGVSHGDKVVEDLKGVEFVDPFNFLTNTKDGNDDHGHGTHVASTIAEMANNNLGAVGVAPKAKIMPLKVLSKNGSGSVAAIVSAIIYAADHGAQVINMSLGGPFPSSVMENAVNYAYKKGVLVVCAAGNDGPREDSIGYPAAYKNSVAVSSVDSLGNLAWYSSWGKGVAIAAPGGDTRSDHNKDGKPDGVLQNTIDTAHPENRAFYGMFQGTSMACPHVAGVAALIISEGVTCPGEVLQILRATAQKKDDARKFGAGIVDGQAAVQMARYWNFLRFAPITAQVIGFPGILALQALGGKN